jgi:hypothetical protein
VTGVRKTLGAVAVLATCILLTGCSRSLPSDDIERELVRRLSTSDFVPEVSCPEDLPGEEGATITCTSTLGDKVPIDIRVTTTDVSGDQVRWTYEVIPTGFDSGDLSK